MSYEFRRLNETSSESTTIDIELQSYLMLLLHIMSSINKDSKIQAQNVFKF